MRRDDSEGAAMTRLEAAERAAVEAAMAWDDILIDAPPHEITNRATRLSDACARLRDLRERVQEEECGQITAWEIAPRIGNNVDLTISETRTARCTLPRGHAGDCDANLGNVQWHAHGSGEFEG